MYSYSEGLLRSGILEELRRQGSAKDSGIQIPKNHWVDIVHRLVYICIYLHEFWRHDLPSCRVAFACTCTGFALVSFFSTSRGDAERSPFGQLWKKRWYLRRKDLMLGWRPLKTLPPMGLPKKSWSSDAFLKHWAPRGLKLGLGLASSHNCCYLFHVTNSPLFTKVLWNSMRTTVHSHYVGKCWEAWRHGLVFTSKGNGKKNTAAVYERKGDLMITIIIEVPGVMVSIFQKGALLPNLWFSDESQVEICCWDSQTSKLPSDD